MIIKVLLPLALIYIHIHTADDIIITARQREGGGGHVEKERLERETISFILIYFLFFVILSLIGSLLLRH
jgi:hypothetical protein